jgi:hypothetical protein
VETARLYVEALNLAADAIGRMTANGQSAGLDRLRRISLREGAQPSASYDDGALTITVAPTWGVAGRPSSTRIASIIEP